MSARATSFFLFLFLLTPVIPAHSASLDDADERLFKAQLAMAEKGDMRAQYYLGEMHEQGLGTKQDVDQAFKWYTKAAEQGDPMAKRKLAHRQEIVNDLIKEQDVGKLGPSATVVMPANPADKSNDSTTTALTQSYQARQHEQDRIKAAGREKKRAMVRAMILERMRHPVGAPFGE